MIQCRPPAACGEPQHLSSGGPRSSGLPSRPCVCRRRSGGDPPAQRWALAIFPRCAFQTCMHALAQPLGWFAHTSHADVNRKHSVVLCMHAGQASAQLQRQCAGRGREIRRLQAAAHLRYGRGCACATIDLNWALQPRLMNVHDVYANGACPILQLSALFTGRFCRGALQALSLASVLAVGAAEERYTQEHVAMLGDCQQPWCACPLASPPERCCFRVFHQVLKSPADQHLGFCVACERISCGITPIGSLAPQSLHD